MKLGWKTPLAGIVLGLAALAHFSNPAPEAPPASPGDCRVIPVLSNGWHTDLWIAADGFPETHPFRQDFPQASWFMVGWGDEGFFRRGPSLGGAMNAMLPDSPTVLHVIGLPEYPGRYLAGEVRYARLSRAGYQVLVSEIDRALARNESGETDTIAPGNWAGVSRFYRSDLSYHAAHTCNQWTGRVLRRRELTDRWRSCLNRSSGSFPVALTPARP